MAVRRKQKVVLRRKVRHQQWAWFRDFTLACLKVTVLSAALAVTAVYLYRFLFLSGFFMVKSVDVEPYEEQFASRAGSAVSSLKGNSIFKFSAKKLEANLKGMFPEIRAFNVSRSFPDRVKIRYIRRLPVAFLKMGADNNAGRQTEKKSPQARNVVDEEGAVMLWDESRHSAALPQLTAGSTASVSYGIGFIKMWEESGGGSILWQSTCSARTVSVDDFGEVSIYSDGGTRIVWGIFDSRTFSEKFKRFQDVWSDLQKKSIAAQYINLRDVPQRNVLVLSDRETVGRVIVRPADKKNPVSQAGKRKEGF